MSDEGQRAKKATGDFDQMVIDLPYAFWIQAMSRRPGNLAESGASYQVVRTDARPGRKSSRRGRPRPSLYEPRRADKFADAPNRWLA
jgi:hypothetical protein